MNARARLLKFMILGQQHPHHLASSLLEMQILEPHPRPTVSDRMSQGPRNLCSNMTSYDRQRDVRAKTKAEGGKGTWE